MLAVDVEDASNVVLHDILRVLGRVARHSEADSINTRLMRGFQRQITYAAQ